MSAYSANAPGPPDGEPMTRWPVSTISPQSSTPGVYGRGGFSWYMPMAMRTSGKFSAAARTLTRTWPSAGVGWSTSSRLMTFEGSPSSCTRHARMPATLPDAGTVPSPDPPPLMIRRPNRSGSSLGVDGEGGPRTAREDGSAHGRRAERLRDDRCLTARRLRRRHALELVGHHADAGLDHVGGARLGRRPGHYHRVRDLASGEHREVGRLELAADAVD